MKTKAATNQNRYLHVLYVCVHYVFNTVEYIIEDSCMCTYTIITYVLCMLYCRNKHQPGRLVLSSKEQPKTRKRERKRQQNRKNRSSSIKRKMRKQRRRSQGLHRMLAARKMSQ